ncbi:MAG: hypothetical protein GY832_16225 [Chloroflexi bacterium]|nr:hypothetical protein [Chloroflexota bacterium]
MTCLSFPVAILSSTASYLIEQSIRYDDDRSCYMYRTPSVAGNRKTFTIAAFGKRGNLASMYWFGAQVGANVDALGFGGSHKFQFSFNNATSYSLTSTQVFRDPAAFMGVVVAVDTTQATASNRVKVWINGAQITAWDTANYPSLNYDCCFNDTVEHNIGRYPSSGYFDGYLTDIHFVDGAALTASDFGKFDANGNWGPVEYTGTHGTNGFHIDGADANNLGKDANDLGAITTASLSSATWETSTGWTFTNDDAAHSTAGGYSTRSNNVLIGDFIFSFTATQLTGLVFGVFDATEEATHNYQDTQGKMDTMTNSWYFNEDLGDMYYGGVAQSATPSIAAGSVVTIERTGSTIKITDDAATEYSFSQTFTGPVYFIIGHKNIGGKDINLDDMSITVSNDFATSGLTSADQMLDSPTDDAANGVGGKCVWNPISKGNVTLSNGNLTAHSITNWHAVAGTIGVTSGKWYWEVTIGGTPGNIEIGVVDNPQDHDIKTITNILDTHGMSYETNTGKTYDHSTSPVAYGSARAAGHVVGVALDADDGKLWFSEQGVYPNSGDPAAGANAATITVPTNGEVLVPAVAMNTGTSDVTANFGQSAFAYTPPTGFKALCTANLPAPATAASVTPLTSPSFAGNANADGPYVWLGYTPDTSATSTINGNTITWGAHALPMAGGFKVITSSAPYNSTGTNTISIAVKHPFGGAGVSQARAQ